MLLADTADDDIGQADGGPDVFRIQANQGAEDDDDADAGKRAREASPDDAGILASGEMTTMASRRRCHQ